ncbi:hypothetical protein JW823_02970 [bacterium]|nr:hypothetical protein [candidate division CSSED10-310 bacterium]
MMAKCSNMFKAGSIQEFLAKPGTSTTLACFNYWNGINPSDVKSIEISDSVLSGACKISAISGDAFNMLSKSLNGVSCQSVFTNWKNGEFEVTFWMKDLR